jgi:hypothetical protein
MPLALDGKSSEYPQQFQSMHGCQQLARAFVGALLQWFGILLWTHHQFSGPLLVPSERVQPGCGICTSWQHGQWQVACHCLLGSKSLHGVLILCER